MAHDLTIRGRFSAWQTPRWASGIISIACLALLTCAPESMAAGESMALRHFRGVHVLRQVLPHISRPEVTVPHHVKSHDTTNALLSHPDKTFVLESISRDLDAASRTGKFPESGYYAAHSFAILGKHAEAAAAMKRYLSKAPFMEEHYLFLTRELHAAGKYEDVLAAVRWWQSHAMQSGDICSRDRLAYAWGSFQARGMYRDAMEEVLFDPCPSWHGQVFFAKSSLDLGDEEEATARIAETMAAHPDKVAEIEALWNRLAMFPIYP